MKTSLKMVRADFPFFRNCPDIIYLDSATTSLKPCSVITSLGDFYAQHPVSVYRTISGVTEQVTARYESVRALCAQYSNARVPEEIIFTKSATEGINLVARSWLASTSSPGDEIVLSELEHHANITPWQQIAREKNLTIRWLVINPDGSLDLTQLEKVLTCKTKLVAITAYSNVLGSLAGLTGYSSLVSCLSFITGLAHTYGARVLIDASQLAPHQSPAIREYNPDFVVFSSHKMLGPQGVGVLYIKQELHDQLQPYQTGGGGVITVDHTGSLFRPVPHLFEVGTQAVGEVLAFGAALEYLQKNSNSSALIYHESQLCTLLVEHLEQLKNITILGPYKKTLPDAHLISFIINNWHPHDIAAYLDSKNITVRAGNLCASLLHKRLGITGSVRASVYLYNTPEEIMALVGALRELAVLK